eukprot:s246_g24.t1
MEEGSELPTIFTSSGEVRLHYEFAHFSIDEGGVTRIFNFVPIARLEGGLLAAFSKSSWDRTLAKRELPRRALSKPILVEVAIAAAGDLEESLEEEPIKVWVGFLASDLVAISQPGRAEGSLFEPCFEDVMDGDLRMPYARALVEVSEQHFAFQSAAEASLPSGAMPNGEEESPTMEERMRFLETSLHHIQKSLTVLAEERKKPEEGPRPKSRAERADSGGGAAKAKAAASLGQLWSLAKVLQKPNRLPDQPARAALGRAEDVLGESEEEDGIEELGVGGDGAVAAANPMETAVLQLTKIVGKMAKSSGRDLEALLDGADCGPADAAVGSSGGKSKAAAYKRLRSALTENPVAIYESIEKNMDTDFHQTRSAPGSSLQTMSSRAWVEHRSKVMNYPSSIRAIWQLAGIHDALKVGAFQEARARAAVALASWDQCSLDQGSWVMSQEVTLEPAPPYAAFTNKKLPETYEQAASRLIDERWLAVFQWKLKDQDSYLETKRRLTQSRAKGDGKKEEKPQAPAKQGKGKGAGGGKQQAQQSSGQKPKEEQD